MAEVKTVSRLGQAMSGCASGGRYFFRTVNGKQQKVVCPRYKWEERQRQQTEVARLNAEEKGYKEKERTSGVLGKGTRIAIKAGIPLAGTLTAIKALKEAKYLVQNPKIRGKILRALAKAPKLRSIISKSRLLTRIIG